MQNCTFINGSSLMTKESPVVYFHGNSFINNYVNDTMNDQYEESFSVLVKIELRQQQYWHTHNNISITKSTVTENNVLKSQTSECPYFVNISITDCHFKDNRGHFQSILVINISELTSSSVTIANSVFLNNTAEGVMHINLHDIPNCENYKNISFTYHNNSFSHNNGAILTLNHSTILCNTNIAHNLTDIIVSNSRPSSTISHLIQFLCDQCSFIFPFISLTNVNITRNRPSVHRLWPKAIVYAKNVYLSVVDSQFTFNNGTALCINNSSVSFNGYVSFNNNIGHQGGGLAIYGKSNLSFNYLSFQSNQATFGGAMYIDSDLDLHSLCSANIHVNDNKATIAGFDLYFQNSSQVTEYKREFNNSNCSNETKAFIEEASTPPSTVSIVQNVSVFPGQLIPLDLNIRDANNHDSYCISFARITCDDKDCESVSLTGTKILMLSAGSAITNLYLKTTLFPISSQLQVAMVLQCEEYFNLKTTVQLTIQTCPQGFRFDNSTQICECVDVQGNVYCSNRSGDACITQRLWFGKVNNVILYANCHSPYCNVAHLPCPLDVPNKQMYELLTESSLQCTGNHGGIGCMDCANNSYFTFGGVSCVTHCHSWEPGFIFFLALIFQTFLSLLLLPVLKWSLEFGAGIFYGPFFYFAIISQLPFNSFSVYSTLVSFVTMITTFLFLNMELFGLIPVCTFKNLGPLSNFGLRFLGPIIVIVLVFVMLVIARLIPKCNKVNLGSSLHAAALLLFMSYWTLIGTSVAIMESVHVYIDGLEKTAVALQPELNYFTHEHIPLWLFSFFLVVFLFFPFVLLLMCSCLLARILNIARLKPLLYFYQGCYQSKFQWYPTVYFIAYFIFILAKFSPLFQQLVLITLITMQYLLRPYQLKWMNIVDTLLLLNLLFVSSLLFQQTKANNSDSATTAFIYIFILSSILYAILGGVYVILYQFGLFRWLRLRYNFLNTVQETLHTHPSLNNNEMNTFRDSSQDSNNEVVIIDGATTGFREPLLDSIFFKSDEDTTRYGIQ